MTLLSNTHRIYDAKNILFLAWLMILSIFSISCSNKNTSSTNEIGKEVVYRIRPGEDNPRNSEGDFIQLNDGRMFFIYSHYTGSSGADHAPAYLAGRYSSDGGKSWSEDHMILEREGDMNVMSVSLLRLQNGEIALFYLKKNSTSDCIPMLRISKDEAKTWSEPIATITDKKDYFVLNNDRAIQLKDGRLLISVSLHNTETGDGRLWSYYSDDNGRSWQSGIEVPNPEGVLLQEPGVVELNDGRIMMFIRTNEGVQYQSFSNDKGKSWTPAKPGNIPSPRSPASIERIPSTGDLLLVWNNNGVNQKRTPLCVAISKDEGKTWGNVKIIEDDPEGSFCYTAIHFSEENVFLGYWNRADKHNSSIDINKLNLKWIY
jgi:sialidase-1